MTSFSAILPEEATGRRILVVDDEPSSRTAVRIALESAGFWVGEVSDASEARLHFERHGLPDLALIDIRMPGESGIELARDVHRWSDLPIVMISGVKDIQTVVECLEEVAEDYITKPFAPEELTARVHRILRRIRGSHGSGEHARRLDDRLEVDFVRKLVRRGAEEIRLSPTEAKLLHVLVRDAPRVVRSSFILTRIWPREEVGEEALRVAIYRLRRKLETAGDGHRYIENERGLGYRFVPWEPDRAAADEDDALESASKR